MSFELPPSETQQDSSAKEAATGTCTIEDNATQKIKTLDQNYETISQMETIILDQLDQLQAEEVKLRQALDQAKESRKDKLKREQKEQNDHAIKNLEKALLMDDDSTSRSSARSSDEEDNDVGGIAADVGLGRLEDMLLRHESSSSDDDESNQINAVAI